MIKENQAISAFKWQAHYQLMKLSSTEAQAGKAAIKPYAKLGSGQ